MDKEQLNYLEDVVSMLKMQEEATRKLRQLIEVEIRSQKQREAMK